MLPYNLNQFPSRPSTFFKAGEVECLVGNRSSFYRDFWSKLKVYGENWVSSIVRSTPTTNITQQYRTLQMPQYILDNSVIQGTSYNMPYTMVNIDSLQYSLVSQKKSKPETKSVSVNTNDGKDDITLNDLRVLLDKINSSSNYKIEIILTDVHTQQQSKFNISELHQSQNFSDCLRKISTTGTQTTQGILKDVGTQMTENQSSTTTTASTQTSHVTQDVCVQASVVTKSCGTQIVRSVLSVNPDSKHASVQTHTITVQTQVASGTNATGSETAKTVVGEHCPKKTSTSAEFDIRQLVNIDSYGNFSLDQATMLSMFGFDPRGSPFVPCGYPAPPNLLPSLKAINVAEITSDQIRIEKNDNGSHKEIGRGTYGVVYLGSMQAANKKIVIKEFHNDCVCWQLVEHEAQILTYLSGKEITPDFRGILDLSLVQDYFGSGTIQSLLKNHTPLPTRTWMIICFRICVILHKLHENHVLYNDLKSDNILIDAQNNYEIRFIDFGMATFRQGLKLESNPEHLAQYKFLAPELRECCPSTPLSDIFSLGYLFGEIIKYANIIELTPLWKACTTTQACKRPPLIEILMWLEKHLDENYT